MIEIFVGENRAKAQEQILKKLGEGYEVFEGENLNSGDLFGIFKGETLFSQGKRRILVKDLSENKEVFSEFSEKIEDFVKTEADVILFETKLDKRLSSVKKITKAGVKVVEFKMAEPVNAKEVFSIFDTAIRNGEKAVKDLEKIEEKQDPYMFFGLLVSQALKKLEWKPNGEREKRILRELAEVDILMKTTGVEPWLLIKSFLVRLEKM